VGSPSAKRYGASDMDSLWQYAEFVKGQMEFHLALDEKMENLGALGACELFHGANVASYPCPLKHDHAV